ncbi:MAG TPA: acyl carrier protein [Coprothermobacter proteolyticus]|uniref:Acyl carrier protein n=1 Tax=Coprothermobacter proteolyticus (strain ATCC 35245 / DSM 5265 / OCM 4 / BT) TaxID=309798 RepID=ACP_COPPD|nr:acyl carrier protein [Coprothermobacter proteolyticus]B5Y7W4.1 RecName: Full=Acyl carrier protein; Short=ACP [Coprothermobacter proteolyticus DSM 5265]MBK6586165.1 acyl carrier protein [Coprothermobacter sp.]ACI18221.1 acyl carrier protein [Coprothermobacter proteolyticus DSM 5265]MBP8983720.1 acyl carrier protein [Coprothermobacter sp.]NLT84012.1 acyl carrier protein [Coprothermobacter proteolyticus]HHY43741.1 acyl carrier protein [Coprothermobacter sp.]
MEREKIFQELKNILKDTVTVEEEEITMESDLVNDLNLDSLDLVDLALSVEQVFGFEFSDEQLQQIKTVKDVVDIIESNLYTK